MAERLYAVMRIWNEKNRITEIDIFEALPFIGDGPFFMLYEP